MTQSRARSRGIVLVAIVVSIGLGGLLGHLTRDEPVVPASPGNLSLPAAGGGQLPTVTAQLQAQLDRLIARTRSGDDPRQSPALTALALVAQRDEASGLWLAEQLDDPSLPTELVRELLREIGSKPAGEALVQGRILRRLSDPDPIQQALGVDLIRQLHLGRTKSGVLCRCRAGLYPANRTASGRRFLVAWALEEEGILQWDPTLTEEPEAVWELNLRPSPDGQGSRHLLHSVEEPDHSWAATLETDRGPRIRVRSLD